MIQKTVGEFELEIRGPYPCRVTIKRGEAQLSLRHDDLRDLEYVVATAIRAANALLGPRDSVDGQVHPRG